MSLPLAPGMGDEPEFENAVSKGGDDFADLAYPEIELPELPPTPASISSPRPPASPGESWQKMRLGEGSEIDEPTLPTVLKHHPPAVREKVVAVARKFSISDDDPIWPIVLAMREGDTRYVECAEMMEAAFEMMRDVCQEAPARMREAVEGVTLGYQMNNRVAAENKDVIQKVEGSVKEFTAEVAAMRRDRKWLYRWMIGLTAIVIGIAGWSTVENSITRRLAGDFNTDRFAMVAEAKVLQNMQRLVIERAQVNAIREELKMQYQGFMDTLRENGMTADMQGKKTAIEEAFTALQQREINLEEKEKRAYDKTY